MRRRLALMALATTALVVVAFVAPLAVAVRTIARDRAVREGELQAQALIPVLAVVNDRTEVEAALSRLGDVGDNKISVLLPDGQVVGAPVPAAITASRVLQRARSGEAITAASGRHVEVLIPVDGADGETSVIRALVPSSELTRGVLASWVVLAALGIALLAIAVGVADRLARSITRPMASLAATTRRLREGELEARTTPEGPPEVQEVARTVDQLAERIGELLQAERESMADLSHRLRTPITALRLEADGLSDPAEAARIGAGVDEVASAVDQLIRQAREERRPRESTCDLIEVVRQRVAFWRVLADEQHRQLVMQLPDRRAEVRVDRAELAAALDAIIGNVFAHTALGTAFRIMVVPAQAGWELIVDDRGPGVGDGSALERGRSGRGSTGLGLDIVRQMAERAGGHLRVGRNPKGGARVRIELPEAQAAEVGAGVAPPPESSSAPGNRSGQHLWRK